MPFTIRPYHRFPVPCAVTYNTGTFLKLPPACCWVFDHVGVKELEWWPNNT